MRFRFWFSLLVLLSVLVLVPVLALVPVLVLVPVMILVVGFGSSSVSGSGGGSLVRVLVHNVCRGHLRRNLAQPVNYRSYPLGYPSAVFRLTENG